MPTPEETARKREAARETIDVLHEISIILNCGLDRSHVSLCVSLIENGVNPDALAAVINDLKAESARQAEAAGQEQ